MDGDVIIQRRMAQMKRLINKIINWFKSLFGSNAAELNLKINQIARLEQEASGLHTQINQLTGLLKERMTIVNNLIEVVEQKNETIKKLKQRERDLLDVIHEEQVNELMRGAENDRN